MEINGVNNAQNIEALKNVDGIKKADYQPKVDLNDPVDTVEFSSKEAPKKGKKLGSAIASYFLPGLGQFINGDTKAGGKFLAKHLGYGALAGLGYGVAMAASGPVGLAIACVGGTAALVNGIKSIVHAYKNE